MSSLTRHIVRQAYADSHLSVCAAELHFSVVNTVLYATTTWPFSAWCKYSRMYCITTNTLCTTENSIHYSALTDWLIYHVVWFRVLNFCLFCWLVNSLLLQLCMYLLPVNCMHTGRRTALRFEHETAILRDDFDRISLSIPYRVHCIETYFNILLYCTVFILWG